MTDGQTDRESFIYLSIYYNSVAGEITTTALLDRELKSEYILIVRAVDGGVGPQQKTGIATVTIFQLHSLLYS